jgi:MFS family permease
LTYSITKSALATALVVGLPTISSIVVSPIIGVLADGMNRKRLLVYLSIVQGIVISIFAVLVFMGQISIWYIYILVFINGVFANARSPLRMSIVPNLVPKNFVLNALSLQYVFCYQ